MAWARQYIDAIIQHDVRDVANVKLDQLPRSFEPWRRQPVRCAITQLGGQVGLDVRPPLDTSAYSMRLPAQHIDVWAQPPEPAS